METSFASRVPIDAPSSEEPNVGIAGNAVGRDPADTVAQIAADRRGRLLRIHRRRLRWEDLEDCYSQATLELVARSRRSPFASADHVMNALEQKFLSRIEDKRRAISGRSAIESAIARAVPVDAPEYGATELEDRAAAVEERVIAMAELRQLREVIGDLSRDQQLVLASQVCVDMSASEFCARYGWSAEKYRKVAQRARGKLRVLVEEYERGERCLRLEPDILALSAGVADDQALARARAHLANCPTCARMAADIDRSARSVAALLPLPGVLAGGALAAKLSAAWAELRRFASLMRHPFAEAGGAAGGSMATAGAIKVGIAAVCVAGAAGSYAVCSKLGVLPSLGLGEPRHALAMPGGAPLHAGRAAHTRARHERRRVTYVPAAATIHSQTSTSVTTVVPAHRVAVTHMSAIEQIRREFGSPPARTAASGTAASYFPPTSATSTAPSLPRTPASSSRQASQAQAEFGFER